MVRLANITEKEQELVCGDENCCGYYYVAGRVDTVEIDEDTEKRLKADVKELSSYESVYPEDYGIDTHLDNIGWVEFWDSDDMDEE